MKKENKTKKEWDELVGDSGESYHPFWWKIASHSGGKFTTDNPSREQPLYHKTFLQACKL